jgi:hypothetical protein
VPDSIEIDQRAQFGLRFDIPPDPIPADLGGGPAVTVHLLPDPVACDEVVFAAEGVEMDDEGYWIDIDRLRTENDWVRHLGEKVTHDGHKPAVAMLAEAVARKKLEMGITN